ncbi:MAG: hypothetical protein CM1200mP27_07370 [Chloroflexota bacterium]|nr:MAG: hypothetical protein CM1200mP27_07370 [Chloroflexota bacterium]
MIYSIPLAIEQGVSLSAASFILALISIFSILGRFMAPIMAERMGGKPVMMAALFVQGITVLVYSGPGRLRILHFRRLVRSRIWGRNVRLSGSQPAVLRYRTLATLYGFEMMGALSGHAIATILGGLAIYATGRSILR